MTPKTKHLWLVGAALLLAAAVRWLIIPGMRDMMQTDEAYYLLDALSLIDTPRLTPFFPGNYGRESGFMYLLVPFILGLGNWIFAGRVAAAFIGVVAVAMTSRLAADLFGRRVGLFAGLGLATLYWHVHLSHLVFRAMLMPVFGALAFILLLRALRGGGLRRWLVAGIGFGALGYTYFSSRAWLALIGMIVLAAAWKLPRRRAGALAALAISTVIAAPLLIYAAQNPDVSGARMRDVGVFEPATIAGNLVAWLRAVTISGDENPTQNLPGRPIFDYAQAALALIGCVTLAAQKQLRARGLLLALIAGAAIAPSLLSNYPPHFLRAVGATVPIAILLGVGANALFERVSGLVARLRAPTGITRFMAAGLITVTMTYSALITSQDLYGVWLPSPQAKREMEQPFSTAIAALEPMRTPGDVVFFSPFIPDEALVRFASRKLGVRTTSFDPGNCVAIAERPFWLVSPAYNETALLSRLGEVAQMERTGLFPDTGGITPMGIYTVTPRVVTWQIGERFGDRIELAVRGIPATAEAGAIFDIVLQMRAHGAMDRPYSAFAHVYPTSTGLNGPKFAQADAWLCPTYRTMLWQPGQVFFQHVALALPANTPPGEYQVHVGVYETQGGARLISARGGDASRDSVVVGGFTVR